MKVYRCEYDTAPGKSSSVPRLSAFLTSPFLPFPSQDRLPTMSDIEKRDSDSTPSEERRNDSTKSEQPKDALASLPDPDAGLSDEERARLVSFAQYRLMSLRQGLGNLGMQR